MNQENYIRYIIEPTLYYLSPEIPFTEKAVKLITLTAIAESNLYHLKQLGGGPARGLLQMEPSTEQSLWAHYLRRKHALREKVIDLTLPKLSRETNITGNLFYQVAMARIKYFPDPLAIPDINDIAGMCEYYIRIYNGGGKAKMETVRQIYINRVLGH